MYYHKTVFACLWQSKYGPSVSIVSFVGNINSKCPFLLCSSSKSAIISRSSSVRWLKPSKNEGIIFFSLLFLIEFCLSGDEASAVCFVLVGDPDDWFFSSYSCDLVSESSTFYAFRLTESNPRSRCLFSFFLSSSILLRSNILNPTKWRVSHSSIVFTCLSYGLELERDGATLTSRSHGRSFASTRTSNPYTSKHYYLFFVARIAVVICGSTAIRVLMQSYLMFLKTSS